MIERMKHIKEALMGAIEAEIYNLADADAKELGEVVDMVKDLEEAIYYCTIVKAMEEGDKKKEEEQKMMYTPMMNYNNDMMNRRYYNEGNGMMQYSSGNSGGGSSSSSQGSSSGGRGGNGRSSSQYTEREMPNVFADGREGRSVRSRRMYMEAKETHQGKDKQMKELERYMQELTQDIVEMIEDATPDEKQFLNAKLTGLADKIGG